MTTQHDRWHTGSPAGADTPSDSDGNLLRGLPTAARVAADPADFQPALPNGAVIACVTGPSVAGVTVTGVTVTGVTITGPTVLTDGDILGVRDMVNRTGTCAVAPVPYPSPSPPQDADGRWRFCRWSARPQANGLDQHRGLSMRHLNAGSVPSPTGSHHLVAKADGHATTGSR